MEDILDRLKDLESSLNDLESDIYDLRGLIDDEECNRKALINAFINYFGKEEV